MTTPLCLIISIDKYEGYGRGPQVYDCDKVLLAHSRTHSFTYYLWLEVLASLPFRGKVC